MPQFEAITKYAKSVWRSPDGEREIFEVTLDVQGQEAKASTYSKDIATIGWTGTVETYEKEGKGGRPSQTFVKQPPKEGGYGGGRSQAATQTSHSSSYQAKDEKAIQAMWAIGQSIQAHNNSEALDVLDFPSVEAYAVELNDMVGRVKAEASTDTTAPDNSDKVVPVSGTESDKELSTQMDDTLDVINELFPGTSNEEKPWPQS